MEENAENAQLEILKSSGLLSEFVRNTKGNWNQAELEALMTRIREQSITIATDKIGAVLESERIAFAQESIVDAREATVNFDELGLKRKREVFGSELKKRIR
ncbi:hypothetical protein H0N98_03750 [Candidatus Micrarchaeota archaeon]|nr:hypothetical protein [Candidatus Micrarchaeota archaeon]